MHHNAGLFNGKWSDMAIETTFMRYGHGQTGITGITLKPETFETWAYSLHACNSIMRDLNEIKDKEPPSAQTHHKEDMTPRKKPWPTAGTIQDYLDRFRTYLRSHLARCNVHLVFDW